MSGLSLLMGQRFDRAERLHDYTQLRFADYTLNVYNSIDIMFDDESAPRFVESVTEAEQNIRICLTIGSDIVIDLRSSAWTGPEALALYRTGGECVFAWT